jgi:hypothetical protein
VATSTPNNNITSSTLNHSNNITSSTVFHFTSPTLNHSNNITSSTVFHFMMLTQSYCYYNSNRMENPLLSWAYSEILMASTFHQSTIFVESGHLQQTSHPTSYCKLHSIYSPQCKTVFCTTASELHVLITGNLWQIKHHSPQSVPY